MNLIVFQIVIFLFVSSYALPTPEFEPISLYYHENIGIKEAARIKALEESNGPKAEFYIVGGSSAALGQYPHLLLVFSAGGASPQSIPPVTLYDTALARVRQFKYLGHILTEDLKDDQDIERERRALAGGLVITLLTGGTSVCGSSLVSNTRLVTAAHCWFDGRTQARLFTVVLGSTTLFSGGTRINTSTVRLHEFWNPNNLNNDVAVISIPAVTYSNTIRNIALPSGALATNNFVGWNSVAAGFGRQRDSAGISSNQALHHVSLQVTTNAICQRTFGGAVVTSTLCTDGSSGRSTCGGDSGGPLQVNSGGPVLIGITSFGSTAGCQRGFPAAFARVTSFANWIRSRL